MSLFLFSFFGARLKATTALYKSSHGRHVSVSSVTWSFFRRVLWHENKLKRLYQQDLEMVLEVKNTISVANGVLFLLLKFKHFESFLFEGYFSRRCVNSSYSPFPVSFFTFRSKQSNKGLGKATLLSPVATTKKVNASHMRSFPQRVITCTQFSWISNPLHTRTLAYLLGILIFWGVVCTSIMIFFSFFEKDRVFFTVLSFVRISTIYSPRRSGFSSREKVSPDVTRLRKPWRADVTSTITGRRT